MAAEIGRGLCPRVVRCHFFIRLHSAQRSFVLRQHAGFLKNRRLCSGKAVEGYQQDSSYESFMEERSGRKSNRFHRGPSSGQHQSDSEEQSYYSEWDDDGDTETGKRGRVSRGKQARQSWRRSNRDQMNQGGQSWGKNRGDQFRGRNDSSQTWKKSHGGGGGQSKGYGSSWNDRSSRGGRDHSGGNRWSERKRDGGWSDNEYDEQPFKLRQQIIGELVYGVAPVTGALKACRRQAHKLYVQEGLQPKKRKDAAAVEKAIANAKELGVGVEYVTKHDLNMVVDNRPHQGLALDCTPLDYVPLLELPRASTYAGSRPPVWLALDEVMDPHNLGAIIRSAYFLGATGIIVSAKNSAPLSPAVSKVSSGVSEVFPIHSCVKLQQFLADAQTRGWTVAGAAATQDAIPCSEFRPSKPVILVVGNEGYGLRTTVKQACGVLVQIEDAMSDVNKEFQLDSLNVSVAAGILLHALVTNAKQMVIESG